MLKIGITGQDGFIGKYLYNTVGLFPNEFEHIDFKREFFNNEDNLNEFVKHCDVIVHLAALNRHHDASVIYHTNVLLVEKLIAALNKTNSKAHVLFSSSTQEEKDNIYGQSKKRGRELFASWAEETGTNFTGIIIPNVFGPFGLPNYNSVVATFCYKLAHNETPVIDVDGTLNLIYVGELVSVILKIIRDGESKDEMLIKHTAACKVSKLLEILERFKDEYQHKGIIPSFSNGFEKNLFNTFRCYMDIENHFPVKFTQHKDERGAFTEIIRLNIGGQVSFSTTVPGITRGNHFHTRKIERFAVIKGKALIELRQIGTNKILSFHLDGTEPAYVDMPVWFTHNIKNIGNEELYTIFWINEFYNADDPDTYFENV
jgi:UDP-2-acetamido-2,6-beta-L-arabino-hexul-4-ose reductase